MTQKLAKRICEHCGTTYLACGGHTAVHCVQCFVCHHYLPLHEMYGRVGNRGYCCRACEAREERSTHLVFEVVLNIPSALTL